VRVRRDVSHAIALPHAERLQRRRPAIASIEQLRVGEAKRAVDDRLAIGIQRARAPGKLERCQGYFHGIADLGLRIAETDCGF